MPRLCSKCRAEPAERGQSYGVLCRRAYQLRRKEEVKAAAIEFLGGRCVRCGTTRDLQFDHIDPSTKIESIAKMWLWAYTRLEAEVQKCQLLCKGCHIAKTLADKSQKAAKGTHGTLSSYRYCKCEECRAAMSAYNRAYAKGVRRGSNSHLPRSQRGAIPGSATYPFPSRDSNAQPPAP